MSAEKRCCPGHGSMAHVRGCAHHPEHRPATPDAGDASEVEALAEAVWNAMPAHHVGWRGLKGDQRAFYVGIAERLLPHVAAREAAARAEERERIAQAIETVRSRRWQKHLADHPYSDASSCPYDYGEHDGMYAGARIARGDS